MVILYLSYVFPQNNRLQRNNPMTNLLLEKHLVILYQETCTKLPIVLELIANN